jgi:Helix-turn-helix.
MQDRLLKLLTTKQLSATKFAEIIGVQKSSISHIISGRNKPSFDFIEKVLQKYPEVNPEWLILGKGGMYRQSTQATLFDPPPILKSNDVQESTQNINNSPDNQDKVDFLSSQQVVENAIKRKEVDRVLIFFKDRTFSEYFPE